MFNLKNRELKSHEISKPRRFIDDVSEQILNGTSAQLGYTVPFVPEIQHRRQIKNTDDTQTKHKPEKANNVKHSKTKLAWFSRLL